MKMRNLFVLPAICCALALTPGACGGGKQENAKGARLRRGVPEYRLLPRRVLTGNEELRRVSLEG